jgi:hypothetical protein
LINFSFYHIFIGELSMNKFYGPVGYEDSVEKTSGVWGPVISEKFYYGDVLGVNSRFGPDGQINEDITVSNEISIVADPYAYKNFTSIRYIEWNGVKWKVSGVRVEEPRLVLSLGGVYSEE